MLTMWAKVSDQLFIKPFQIIRLLLTYSPAYDADQVGSAVVIDHGQWAARVALARVAASLADARTNEHFWNLLYISGILVHFFALVVGYDWHIYMLNYVWQWAICNRKLKVRLDSSSE